MYNLTNSPNGPLGQAGMSNSSTLPQGIFSNAGPTFNNFGKGLDNFTSSIADKAQALYNKMFGNTFGGSGSIANDAPPAPAGSPSLFGTPQGLQPGQQGAPTQNNPIAMATAQGTNPTSNVISNAGQAPNAGILAQFMKQG